MLFYSLNPYSSSPLTEAQMLNRPLYAAPAAASPCLLLTSHCPPFRSSRNAQTHSCLSACAHASAQVWMPSCTLGPRSCAFLPEKLSQQFKTGSSSSTLCALREYYSVHFSTITAAGYLTGFRSTGSVWVLQRPSSATVLLSLYFSPGAQPVFEDWLNKQKFKMAFCKRKNHLS